MVNTSKVVQINSQREELSDSALFAKMPSPFGVAKERGHLSLQPLLQALFDNIDDALFELADKAVHNSEQNMYFESMREIRIRRRGMELGFTIEINDAFRQLVGMNTNPPVLSDPEKPVDIDQLALVENDELEELVAIDSMIAKANNALAVPLYHFTTRLNTMLGGVTIANSNNPFGPAVICKAFINVCHDLDVDIKVKLVLFKLFDRYVMKELGKVYSDCNCVLIDAGVLPSLVAGSAGADSASQTTSAGTLNESYSEVFKDLQVLLHKTEQPNESGSSGLLAPGLAPVLPQQMLIQLLQKLQQSQITMIDDQNRQALQGTMPEKIDIQKAISSLLVAQMPSQALSVGQVDQDAINLVAMLFQFVLDDRNMAAPMKALISRLQIPIIKVAMLDKSFFSKGGHPARKLLNEIAHASLGWTPPANIERDPLYTKVLTIVNRLLNEFEGDVLLFDEMLADFLAFLQVESRRSGLVVQRTVNAEDGKAKTELARAKVQETLNDKVSGKSLPKVVITLLEEAWSNVLFLVYLKEGEGKNWTNALNVVDELLWSVEPMQDTASRQRLLTLVPSLLKNLRTGLTKIAYNPFDMNTLFADLETIHLAQLKAPSVARSKPDPLGKTLDEILDDRSAQFQSLQALDAELAEFDALGDILVQSVEEQPQAEPVIEPVLERQLVEEIVVSGAPVDPIEEPGIDLPENDLSLQQVDSLVAGNWVELHQGDGKKFRCRLAAVIRSTGKRIFVNRAGMKVAEHTRQSLAQALKAGKVTIIDDGLLFDRALESVISSLRQNSASSK